MPQTLDRSAGPRATYLGPVWLSRATKDAAQVTAQVVGNAAVVAADPATLPQRLKFQFRVPGITDGSSGLEEAAARARFAELDAHVRSDWLDESPSRGGRRELQMELAEWGAGPFGNDFIATVDLSLSASAHQARPPTGRYPLRLMLGEQEVVQLTLDWSADGPVLRRF